MKKDSLGFCFRNWWSKISQQRQISLLFFVVVQSLSHVWLFATQWTAASQASQSFTISRNLLKLMSIESVLPSNYLIFYLSLLLLPSVFASIRVFSSESALHIRWSKYWSFSFSISPSNEYSELISLLSKGLSRVFSSTTIWKHPFFSTQFLHGPTVTSVHDY